MKRNKNISEQYINDAAYLKIPKKKQLVVTNDTIVESVDFYRNDPPESIANKIVTYNLSDISSMGSSPYAYTLSLSIPKSINHIWLTRFTNKLLLLQKKYNFFLIGGDLSQSKKITISSNFFGYVSKGKILKRTGAKINDDIWITGNIGESAIGLKVRQKRIKINNFDKNYFLKKYLYPVHCPLGDKLVNYASSAIDISDGFYGDLLKLINDKNYGFSLMIDHIPFSNNAKKLIKNRKININTLLSSGDDYELIFTANSKNSSIIKRISKKNNIKVTKVGKIIRKNGIYLDNKKLKIINKSFEHFA